MLVPPSWSSDQLGAIRGIATATVAVALFTACCLCLPMLGLRIPPPEDRIRLWLKWNIPKAACLFHDITTVGKLRFKSPADIMGAGLSTKPSIQVQLMRNLLQNTLEQVVASSLASGGFAALAPPQCLVLVPAYSVLFVIGRVLFAAGYARGAPHRAVGFALSYLPTGLMLGWSCALLLFNPW